MHRTNLKAMAAAWLLAAGLMFAVPAVQAAGNGWLDRANEGGLNEIAANAYGQTGAPRSVPEIVASIIKIILGFLGVMFVVLIIVSGFQYMTAGGNEEKVQKATGRIRDAVIGLLIILAAYGLTIFITNQVLKATLNNQL